MVGESVTDRMQRFVLTNLPLNPLQLAGSGDWKRPEVS